MVNPSLQSLIDTENTRETFPAAQAMTAHLAQHYGPGVRSIVFYGSCLRLATDENLMLDFYVLVDCLAPALGSRMSAVFCRLLPPNVYYHECPFEGRTVRAKVAVMTLDQFTTGTSPRTFASALWARFAQPAAIVHAADADCRQQTSRAIAQACMTLLGTVAPLMEEHFTAEDLWRRALKETYAAELRPESDNKAAEIVSKDRQRYEQVGTAALNALPMVLPAETAGSWRTDGRRHSIRRARRMWVLRRWWGKTLNLLRLIKAGFTFKGGLDYAAWKIERHSGVKVHLTDKDRAHPVWTGLKLFFEMKRRGALK